MKKEEFLKEFDKYSEKFLGAVPRQALGYSQWLIMADDFRMFVETGKLPNQLDEEVTR